jgi:hypothetical protein
VGSIDSSTTLVSSATALVAPVDDAEPVH